MNIVITGGCGFLGSNLAAEALRKQINLTVFDSLCRDGSTKNLQWLNKQGTFEFVHGDIRNQNDVNRLIREHKPDVVFHLAGQVAMTTSIANPRLDFEVNAQGSLNVLEAVREYAPNAAVLYSSTNKVYGDLEQFTYLESVNRYECVEQPNGFDESTTLDFHSPYGCSKGAADQYMLDYARMFGLKTVVFRHSSMYGGRQYATYDQGWIGWFCRQALDAKAARIKEPFTISGNGKQVRDVLHAEDMVRLYFQAVEHIESARGQAFNIGGGIGNSLSLLELFAILEGILGVKLNYIKLPVRESDQRVFVANLSKSKQYLDWSPSVTARQGLARMLDWVGQENE